MPINVRRDDDERGGNRFTPARFSVPVDIDDPAARMAALGAIARSWRHEPAIGLTEVLAGVLSHLPDAVTTSIFGSMLKGVDFVATNVPGSWERRWLAGAEVVKLYGFGPTSGAAVSFALVSHLDVCCVGVNTDTVAIPDPDVLLTCLQHGFAEVVAVGRRRASRRPVTEAPAPTERNRRGGPRGGPPLRLDASFLESETALTPMHIGALLVLEGGPLTDEQGRLRFKDVQAELDANGCPAAPGCAQRCGTRAAGRRPTRVRGRPGLRSCPPRPPHRAGAARFARTELEALSSRLQMEPLDRSRPLWEMWFVSGLADGSVGLVYKVHHAVVDGVSAAETFEILLGPDEPATSAPALMADPEGTAGRLRQALADDLRTFGGGRAPASAS